LGRAILSTESVLTLVSSAIATSPQIRRNVGWAMPTNPELKITCGSAIKRDRLNPIANLKFSKKTRI